MTKTKRKRGGQPGNKNAVGHGAPLGNKNAFRHGLYERWPPQYVSEMDYRVQAKERLRKRQEQFWEDVGQLVELDSLNSFRGSISVATTISPDGSRITEHVQCVGWFPKGRGLVRRHD